MSGKSERSGHEDEYSKEISRTSKRGQAFFSRPFSQVSREMLEAANRLILERRRGNKAAPSDDAENVDSVDE